MSKNQFFDESKEQSTVKSIIVSKYFWAWARVIMPSVRARGGNLAYIDLFAGPGRYKDGAKSTPILVLEKAIEEGDLRERLLTIFNDADEDNTQDLETTISNLDGIESLRHPPKVFNSEVGTEIVQMFEQMKLVPTLFFVDPWGYKGLSLRLIGSVLKDWGCDCIFFFNYNRINMGLTNPIVKEHMDALFGPARADDLRRQLEPLTPEERELTVVEAISQALKDMGGEYVLPFTFKRENGDRTSHHLIFVSKNVRGYEIMKEIMAQQSSSTEQGVPTFAYSPASKAQPLLFELGRPLDELVDMLPGAFAGQTLTMQAIYEKHHVGRRYIKKNYKEALKKLEQGDRIKALPSAGNRPKRNGEATFADAVEVAFP